MSVVEGFVQEFEMESAITRRVLARVPDDRLTWKPHPKSMSAGVLAHHLAMTPSLIAEWALVDSFEAPDGESQHQPSSTAEVLALHDEGVNKVKAALNQIGDAGLQHPWQMTKKGVTVFGMPSKAALVRMVVLNHSYHHRGQLSVYLRLLDVPVPAIYGPSADESSPS